MYRGLGRRRRRSASICNPGSLQILRRILAPVIAVVAAFGLLSALPFAQQPSVPATRFARSKDGTKIAYDIAGSGPPVILLHGRGQTRQSWHRAGYADVRGNQGQPSRPNTVNAPLSPFNF